MRPRLLAGAMLLAVAGCGTNPAPPDAPANGADATADAAAASPAPAQADGPRLAAAVRAAFPRGTIKPAGYAAPYRFDDHRLIDAPSGPVLASYGTAEADGAPLRGILVLHHLQPEGQGFVVRPSDDAVSTAAQGPIGEWEVSDKFLDTPVIQARLSEQARGVRCEFVRLTELTRDGSVDAGSFAIGYDDSGARGPEGQVVEGKLGRIDKGQGFTVDYVVVRYSSTQSFPERYVRQGSRFVREGGKSRVPQC